jgi:hypothetical protein
MMGELSARVGERPADGDDDTLVPIEGIPHGARPAWWPSQLADLEQLDESAALVLSSVCASCRKIALELARTEIEAALPLRLVIACGTPEAGLAFLGETGLREDERTYIDVAGDWVRRSFGVSVSPALLRFKDGALYRADTLGSVKALHSSLVAS